jgi:hypothetical protein
LPKQKREMSKIERTARQKLGENVVSGGGRAPLQLGKQLPDIVFDPSTLGTALPGFFKNPATGENVEQAALLAQFPGLVLPGMEGFAPGEVTFRSGDEGFALVPPPAPEVMAPVPERATGGSVPMPAKDGNPFGGLRMPTAQLIQQFQTGGQPNLDPAAQVSQFNPFANQGALGQQAASTLQNTLATGQRTDTGAIKDANTAVAQQQFQNQTEGINEELGALGLGSSSSRTRAIGEASAQMNSDEFGTQPAKRGSRFCGI